MVKLYFGGVGEPGNLDLLRDVTDLIERLGWQPATIRDARRLLASGGAWPDEPSPAGPYP